MISYYHIFFAIFLVAILEVLKRIRMLSKLTIIQIAILFISFVLIVTYVQDKILAIVPALIAVLMILPSRIKADEKKISKKSLIAGMILVLVMLAVGIGLMIYGLVRG